MPSSEVPSSRRRACRRIAERWIEPQALSICSASACHPAEARPSCGWPIAAGSGRRACPARATTAVAAACRSARLGDQDRLAHFVPIGAPAEAAAQIGLMKIDLFGFQPGKLRRHPRIGQRRLRTHPDIQPVGAADARWRCTAPWWHAPAAGFHIPLPPPWPLRDDALGVAVIAGRDHRAVQRVPIIVRELFAVGLRRPRRHPTAILSASTPHWRASNCRRPPRPHRPA